LLLTMQNKNILSEIQTELKAPKGQRNNFGNYNYRSAEDILEAVKPILKKHTCALIISDDVVSIEGRVYVKSEAILISENVRIAYAVGFAREAESKKGMDESQITGSASSYARKYALNGLLCIDDTKDSDFSNNHEDKSQVEKSTNNNQLI
ncbi:MAG: hypothetical protein ABS34_12240, partial [Opitutaceae bacterium BACL24 MAG-120322-bin51]